MGEGSSKYAIGIQTVIESCVTRNPSAPLALLAGVASKNTGLLGKAQFQTIKEVFLIFNGIYSFRAELGLQGS